MTRVRPVYTGLEAVVIPEDLLERVAHFQDRAAAILSNPFPVVQQLVHDAGQYEEAVPVQRDII